MPTQARNQKVSLNPQTFHVEPPPATEALDTEDQGVVQSSGMREATLPLSRLKDGDFFRLERMEFENFHSNKLVHKGWTYGQRIYGNDCRVRVRLAGGQEQVVFDDLGGKRREFEASGVCEVNYPTMLDVVRIDINEVEQLPAMVAEERGDMKELTEAQVKGLNKRWEFATAQLVKATEGKDAGKTEVAQKRLDAIVTEAETAGVKLGARVEGTKPGGAALTQTKAAQQKTADKVGVAALKAKAEKVKKEPKLVSTQNCLCGCGLETGGKFCPGHDARVKGMLLKVERGEMKAADLPATLVPHVKFAGKSATAGKEDGDYRIIQAPVKFPGRDDIKVV